MHAVKAEHGHALGDVARVPAGDVFVTDSYDRVVYRLRPGAAALEPLRNPRFHSLQGAAPSLDGRFLSLADDSLGLLRLDLETLAAVRLADAPGSTSVGCDGIVSDHGSIIAVQNGRSPARVMRFVLDAGGIRIARAVVLDRSSAIADQPTIGTIGGGDFVYVANSQWEKHGPRGEPIAARRLTRPVLLAVPLR